MRHRHQNLSGILAAAYLLLIILVVLYSWIGSAVGGNIRSLFSADGLRWAFSHFVPNLAAAPWAQLLIGITTLSIIIQSGIRRVVYGEKYRLTDGIELLQRAGIEVVYLEV